MEGRDVIINAFDSQSPTEILRPVSHRSTVIRQHLMTEVNQPLGLVTPIMGVPMDFRLLNTTLYHRQTQMSCP